MISPESCAEFPMRNHQNRRLDDESRLHVLRDCNFVKQVWEVILPSIRGNDFKEESRIDRWVTMNFLSKDLHGSGLPWSTLFGIACSKIWNGCNMFLFSEDYRLAQELAHCILRYTVEVVKADMLLPGLANFAMPRVERWIAWQPPVMGQFKLNTYGSVKGQSGYGGGIIRDGIGKWISGFVHNIGSCFVLCAELWALYEGIKLAWSLGIRNLWVDCDSLLVMKMVNDDFPT
ncbi:hypothetical protein GH714_037522 [Hevea brasiliensis]|uniref:RNase H type-1 domain-containing protein n=1 Tax=Hevea brasiliensis TaxID=3981 RepID=A0A6A6KMW1_HEVBR|nr:hypothetical protein GH714_037522 [Hevea brasiliensis]